MRSHGSHGELRGKVRDFRTALLDDHGAALCRLLPAESVQRAVEAEGVVFRECLFTPLVTLWTFLFQVLGPDGSCRAAVARLLAARDPDGEDDPLNPATDPYCKARQRLPEPLIVRLAKEAGGKLHESYPAGRLLGGRPVKVVDGTTVSMPDTEENQKLWPQPPTQKPGLGFPLARLVAVMSLNCAAVLSLAIGPYAGKQSGETALFRTLLDESFQSGDVLLADRYYASFWMIAMLLGRGVDSLMRQHQKRSIDFRTGVRLGRDDHLIVLTKPSQRPDWMDQETYRQMPSELTVRELRLRVAVKGFRVKWLVLVTTLLVTTLLDAQLYPKDEIARAFGFRWHVELDLRAIKQTMGMSVLRCKTPEMVRKEIWMHLLAYNLVRGLMATAAEQAGTEPREVSFAGAVQTINAFGPILELADPEDLPRLFQILLRAIARHRVGDRPGRYEPRAVKRRAKPIALLTAPREQARKRLAKSAEAKC